jgi:D-amino-acid dehydrogenase
MSQEFWKWGTLFLARNGARDVQNNSTILSKLGLFSRKRFEEIAGTHSLGYGNGATGSLQVFKSMGDMDTAIKHSAPIQAGGVEYKFLTTNEALFAVEPLLSQTLRGSTEVVGGLFSADDTTGDCRSFTADLCEIIRRNVNCEILLDNHVLSIDASKGRVKAVNTTKTRIECDALVLCTASQTSELVKPLGLAVPVYPVKVWFLLVVLETMPE